MGATDFTTYHAGENLAKAYNDAVREATSEYGNDPYNGTISTTSGADQVVREVTTRSAAGLFAAANIERAHKWEAALAVPVADDKNFTYAREKFTVELTDSDERSWSAEHDLEDKARRIAHSKHGARVHAVEVKAKVKTKVVTTPAAGRSVLRWQSGSHRLFDTKTEALRHAREQAAGRQGTIGVKQVRVWPDSTFSDKTLAAEVTEVAVKATAEVTVTIATPKRHLVTEGWLFFGLAAC